MYPTLAAAVAAAPADRLSVVEIDDDGPLFETPTSFADRSLIICAGAGYRPLIVWDVPRSPDGKRALFVVERGKLRLENLDVACALRDVGGLALLDAHDADLWADGCTFSAASTPREGTVVARFHGTRPDAALCRLSRCYLRGPAVTAVDVDAPGASVLIDRSLVGGGDAPLIQVLRQRRPRHLPDGGSVHPGLRTDPPEHPAGRRRRPQAGRRLAGLGLPAQSVERTGGRRHGPGPDRRRRQHQRHPVARL